MTAAASAAVLTLSSTTFAGGTGEEAKAMLTKAVAAVKADEAKAFDQFNKGEGGFLEGDLYVFCAQASDGKIVALANQNAKQLIGTDRGLSKIPPARSMARNFSPPHRSRKDNSRR